MNLVTLSYFFHSMKLKLNIIFVAKYKVLKKITLFILLSVFTIRICDTIIIALLRYASEKVNIASHTQGVHRHHFFDDYLKYADTGTAEDSPTESDKFEKLLSDDVEVVIEKLINFIPPISDNIQADILHSRILTGFYFSVFQPPD